MLIQKTHDHPQKSVMRPPTTAGAGDAGDDRLRHELKPRGAESLHHAGGDQPAEVGSEAARERGDEEQAERREEHAAGADHVAEFAEDGQHHGGGQGVADHDPAHVLERAEITGDRGERGRDHRVVEGADEGHREQGRDEHAKAEGGKDRRRHSHRKRHP
jgi:hypothetical protein